jgi:ABC-type transport system involved in multi-copper enzyme maturation permease subunit
VFSALLWKEWRQLRGLRWTGVAIAALTPPMLLVFGEAAERGWLFGNVTTAEPASVLQDATPLTLSLAIWPLLALMAAAQAFGGDRAAGTDAFLLQRPVRRSRVWQARGIAAVGSTLTIVAISLGFWWLLLRLIGDPAAFDESAAVAHMLLQGALATCLATVSGAVAAAFVRTPIQAVLLGIVLTALPVGFGVLIFDGLFGSFKLLGVRLGLGLPVLLVAGYALGSFAMDCRGEPAGRGRLRRGLRVLTAALVAMPVVLVVCAPIVLRWDARLGLGNTRVIPSPAGDRALVLNDGQMAAWMIDTASGETLRFFPRPVFEAGWSADGSTLAMLHAAGRSGRVFADPRLEFFTASGERHGSPLSCANCAGWWGTGVKWVGDSHIVVAGFAEGDQALLITDLSTGRRQTLTIPGPLVDMALVRPIESEDLYVFRFVRRPRAYRDGEPVLDGLLSRLDPVAAKLEAPVELRDVGYRFLATRGLSPSGRYWLRHPASGDEPMRLVDLDTGETTEFDARWAVWLAGDTPAWVVKPDENTCRLFIGWPGRERKVRDISGRTYWLDVSPDGGTLLVRVLRPGEPNQYRHALFELATDRWLDLEATSDSWFGMQWAGPDSLALVEQGALSLIEPATGELHTVIGRPRI